MVSVDDGRLVMTTPSAPKVGSSSLDGTPAVAQAEPPDRAMKSTTRAIRTATRTSGAVRVASMESSFRGWRGENIAPTPQLCFLSSTYHGCDKALHCP